MKIAMGIVAALALTGCAAPSFYVTAEHESHALQHIADRSTRYGRDVMGLEADFTRGPVTLTLIEGYSVHGNDGCAGCPRDAFTATLKYRFGGAQ